MLKNFFLLISSIYLLIFFNVLPIFADDNKCAKVFENNCAECHEIDRGCELLGQSKKEWKKLFEFMVAMGADIPDDEKTLLTNCLNKPDDGVKETCKK
jgi:cytochrome c2